MGKYGEDKKDELIALGFLFENQRAKYGYELIKSALIRHREVYGNFLVKQKFRIPSGESLEARSWPEEMWGINLGTVLYGTSLCCIVLYCAVIAVYVSAVQCSAVVLGMSCPCVCV